MQMLRIGQVAKESGVGVETVRFYENEGLIEAAERSASGYRQFSTSTIEQIRFIQHAKKLGFALQEISELVNLKNAPDANCADVKKTARAKIADIQEKIDSLEQIKTTLQPLVDQCKSADPISDCPILNALDENLVNE
ncbi:MAG: heavy metal-responsive transcriptional regulator [Gammaproteobacteria bacterium]|nr:MAG: heavy metal-responsive transcriptional regulator [Gammaproteobacteria bacterium]